MNGGTGRSGAVRSLALWGPVVLHMALIFGMSSVSHPPALPGRDLDKLVHAVLYAGLSALLVRALAGGWQRPVTLRIAVLAAALATMYGVSDEIHQAFVPPRESDPRDLVADGIGAALAAGGMYAGIIRGPGNTVGPDGRDA